MINGVVRRTTPIVTGSVRVIESSGARSRQPYCSTSVRCPALVFGSPQARPTAVQLVAFGHDSANSDEADGSGLAMIIQAPRPFQCSTTV